MTPALSQVCSLHSSFDRDLEDYAAGHCSAIDVWLTKLETYLQSHSTDHVRQLLREHAMAAPVASFQGGLLHGPEQAQQQAWQLFTSRLQLCRELDIGTLVVTCDVRPPLDQQGVERVRSCLARAAEHAAGHRVRLALEFQAGAALGNNLQTAAALVGEIASPHLGICLDVFHYYVGPSKPEDLGLLTRDNLFHVQLCDLADTPREFARDSDRILPGDGDIPLEPIIRRIREIGYEGCVSVELMNPQIWQIDPRTFGEIGMTALRKVMGQASMD